MHGHAPRAEPGRWRELAPGVLARRYAELDQTLGVILGERRCLVVDTGRDEAHGAEFAAAIRRRSGLPTAIALTHAHFDHVFGTAALPDGPVWAQRRCAEAITDTAETARAEWVAHYGATGKPAFAAALAQARVVLPTEAVDEHVIVDLGGRQVVLRYLGRGHTDHDLLVDVPDAGVLFAGDLVEQGAPPSVGEDAHPREWPATLDALLALGPRIVVPGHGEPVDPAFVAAQRDELAAERGCG